MTKLSTFSGRVFDLSDPCIEAVSLMDIAHALSNLCRFAGHTRYFYSVAQHSVLVSRWCVDDRDWSPKAIELQRMALLHDAAEAYTVDLPRPLKSLLATSSDSYERIEATVHTAIMQHFGLPTTPHERVKRADALLLAAEMRDLLGDGGVPNRDRGLPNCDLVPAIDPLLPRDARDLFMARAVQLGLDGREVVLRKRRSSVLAEDGAAP